MHSHHVMFLYTICHRRTQLISKIESNFFQNDSSHGRGASAKQNEKDSAQPHTNDVPGKSKSVQSTLKNWMKSPRIAKDQSDEFQKLPKRPIIPKTPTKALTTSRTLNLSEANRKDAEHDDNGMNEAVITSPSVISHQFQTFSSSMPLPIPRKNSSHFVIHFPQATEVPTEARADAGSDVEDVDNELVRNSNCYIEN